MEIAPLDVPDAWVCTPRQFPDDRGTFAEWFRVDLLADAVGRRFDVVQANHSVSRRGSLRGIHYADVPPGQAKFVYCTRGAVLDVVVDLRVGSPAFGRHAVVRLDDVDRRAVYVAEGLGHGFVALSDHADVTYLLTTSYNPAVERGVTPFDPDLALPWPTDSAAALVSPKDRDAPSVQQAEAAGLLPSYDACRARYAALR